MHQERSVHCNHKTHWLNAIMVIVCVTWVSSCTNHCISARLQTVNAAIFMDYCLCNNINNNYDTNNNKIIIITSIITPKVESSCRPSCFQEVHKLSILDSGVASLKKVGGSKNYFFSEVFLTNNSIRKLNKMISWFIKCQHLKVVRDVLLKVGGGIDTT